eukprot:7563716-Pyramimonas_sp.AAC.1
MHGADGAGRDAAGQVSHPREDDVAPLFAGGAGHGLQGVLRRGGTVAVGWTRARGATYSDRGPGSSE